MSLHYVLLLIEHHWALSMSFTFTVPRLHCQLIIGAIYLRCIELAEVFAGFSPLQTMVLCYMMSPECFVVNEVELRVPHSSLQGFKVSAC